MTLSHFTTKLELMKKYYTKSNFEEIKIETNIFCGSGHGNSNHDGWLNENGEPWKPGDGKPIKPAAEYRNDLWE